MLKAFIKTLHAELFARHVVTVWWEHSRFTHRAYSLADAKEWAECYPQAESVSIGRFGAFSRYAENVVSVQRMSAAQFLGA